MLPERRGDFVEDVTFVKVEVGLASDFRKAINDNFDTVKTAVDSIGNKIVVSNNAPTNQRAGDVWISPA